MIGRLSTSGSLAGDLSSSGSLGGSLSNPSGGADIPSEVRNAILTLFEAGAYAETGLTDEIAIIQSWATEVTSLTLSPRTLSLNGDTPQTITATVVPSSASVVWSSSDTSIATVVGGVVTGASNGTCVITASAGTKSATCSVTVSGFATLESISAVYTQSGTVYEDTSLDDLKADLVVTATYSDSSTAVVTDYTLSGTLAEGTSTITVSYGGKTATFNVTVTDRTGWHYDIEHLTKVTGSLASKSTATCGMLLSIKTVNGRSFVVGTGDTSIALGSASSDTPQSQTSDYYPIKIPEGATSVTVSIEPATQYVQILSRVLNEGVYSTLSTITGWTGYQQGGGTKTYESAPDNAYIFVSTRYDSGGTQYPVEPTALDITFS